MSSGCLSVLVLLEILVQVGCKQLRVLVGWLVGWLVVGCLGCVTVSPTLTTLSMFCNTPNRVKMKALLLLLSAVAVTVAVAQVARHLVRCPRC